MSLPVVILAGGLATRLGPVSERTPKSLTDVGGRPFVVHQLELLRRHGLTDVTLLVGHLGEMIRDALGDGRPWGVRLRYVSDGVERRGTGGAIAAALPALDDPFFVIYGDSYLECDYPAIERMFLASGKRGLMTVCRNDDRWDRSNVVYDGARIVQYDKRHRSPEMRHIDYGLGVFRKAAFENRLGTAGAFDLVEIYQELLAAHDLAAFEVPRRFYEIGSPEGLAETRTYLAEGEQHAMSYARRHLDETAQVVAALDAAEIEKTAALLADLRARGGRLFFLGVGGSAANCSHAVNDFRKIAGIEAYTPVDNVSELTARTNDEGWDQTFAAWLQGSRLRADDMLFILSVGGGSLESNVSPNLVRALQYATEVGARIVGIVGRDGGYTARVADACVIVPVVNPETVTPHSEAFQAVVWHLLVSHPALKAAQTKWESTAAAPSSSTGTA